MNNPAASGGESDPEEIEDLEPPCARQVQTSAKVSKGRCGQEQARAGGVPGRSGRCLFQPAALPPSRASSTALGGVASDAVASGSRLDDLHGAAVAGMGAVLHGGPQCGE